MIYIYTCMFMIVYCIKRSDGTRGTVFAEVGSDFCWKSSGSRHTSVAKHTVQGFQQHITIHGVFRWTTMFSFSSTMSIMNMSNGCLSNCCFKGSSSQTSSQVELLSIDLYCYFRFLLCLEFNSWLMREAGIVLQCLLS